MIIDFVTNHQLFLHSLNLTVDETCYILVNYLNIVDDCLICCRW